MAFKVLLPLALVVSCTASVLPSAPSDESMTGWVSYPINRIPRTEPLSKRDADTDVPLYNITSISYMIELSIGTPGQTVKVAIDTGSDELWVNPNCSSSDLSQTQQSECYANKQYDPDDSSTADLLTATGHIAYGKGYVEFEYVKDTITLPNSDINVTAAQFGVATQSQQLNEGILGLSFGYGYNLNYNNFIDDLADQNITRSRAFSVALGSVDENNGGTIIFGGVDTKKFSGSLITNDILAPQGDDSLFRYWIQLDSITLSMSDKSKAYSGANIPIVLDTGSSLSYLPSTVVQSMADDFNGQYDSQSGLYLVSCSVLDANGTLDFAFGDAIIKVPFDEFIWQYDSTTCILGAVASDDGTGSSASTALLGDTFMRSAFVVFDQTKKTISMAQYVDCGQNEQIIPASGVSNVTGECEASSKENKKNAGGRASYSSAALVACLVAGFAVGLS